MLLEGDSHRKGFGLPEKIAWAVHRRGAKTLRLDITIAAPAPYITI